MWFVRVFIICYYGCLSAANVRPNFTSKNFKNVLHWERLETLSSGQEVLYSVEYRSHSENEPFKIKSECQNITALSCDLTAETPAIYDVQYFAQVYANGQFHGNTVRFKPMAQTVLGPPKVSTNIIDLSLYVNVILPQGPNNASIMEIFNSYKPVPLNPSTVYTLKITKPLWATQVNKSTAGQFVINLEKREEHCGYVVYMPNFEHGRDPSEAAFFCATPPGDPWMIFLWFLVATAVLMVPAIISTIKVFLYVKGVKEIDPPDFLVNRCNTCTPVLQPPDPSISISKPEVSPKHDNHTVLFKPSFKPSSKPQASFSTGPDGYSPQDVPFEILSCDSTTHSERSHSSTPPRSEDTSGQSVIYSSVGVNEPAKETLRLNQDTPGERQDMSFQFPSLPSLKLSMDNCRTNAKLIMQPLSPDLEQPILLHTIVDSNGKLMLPLFTFDSQTMASASPPTPEGKPLLSDLLDTEDETPLTLFSLHSTEDTEEWFDSGSEQSTLNTPTQLFFNSCDSPIQPLLPRPFPDCQGTQSGQGPFESGYKLTWMPAAQLGITTEDNHGQVVTHFQQTWDEENIKHIPRHITLGGCMQNIQE